jgi:hypothetical protein
MAAAAVVVLAVVGRERTVDAVLSIEPTLYARNVCLHVAPSSLLRMTKLDHISSVVTASPPGKKKKFQQPINRMIKFKCSFELQETLFRKKGSRHNNRRRRKQNANFKKKKKGSIDIGLRRRNGNAGCVVGELDQIRSIRHNRNKETKK